MNAKILTTENFKKYLEENYSDIVIPEPEVVKDGSYNAFFSMKPGDVLISILISNSPLMINAINNYVNTYKQNMIVTVDGDQYRITPQNIKTMVPILQDEALISFNDEQKWEK